MRDIEKPGVGIETEFSSFPIPDSPSKKIKNLVALEKSSR
jgi:hypothetical protein